VRVTASIRVEANGPYHVRGAPLVRTAKVKTAYGEPVAWAPVEPVETPPDTSDTADIELCRCGDSSTKPFCDRSDLCNGFDGTETADHGPSSARRRAFAGDGVVMTDDRSLCSAAGFCDRRNTDVWEMIGNITGPRVREQLVAMIERCPSGRLQHMPAEGDRAVEPTFQPSVAVVRDGPLWVRGGIRVTGADGRDYEVRNRVTLCRCGHSANKPFCDGTHEDVGFRDG
jgi:CDGSH-type Zn-finger protein